MLPTSWILTNVSLICLHFQPLYLFVANFCIDLGYVYPKKRFHFYFYHKPTRARDGACQSSKFGFTDTDISAGISVPLRNPPVSCSQSTWKMLSAPRSSQMRTTNRSSYSYALTCLPLASCTAFLTAGPRRSICLCA